MTLLKRLLSYFIIITSLLCMENIAYPQTADIHQEIDELKQGQQAIQRELQEIRSLLEKIAAQTERPLPPAGPAIKDVEFEIGDIPVKGDAAAKLILIEFTDYECPYCGRYVNETFPQIQKAYIDKGTIQYAVIDLPLPIHPKAPKAAEASHCAAEQGKFWEIHELMMSKQEMLGELTSYAVSLKLDVQKFDECVNSGKYADRVNRGVSLARKLGVNAVPGFIIGRVDSSKPGKVTGILFITGAMPFAVFQAGLDIALASQ